MWSISTDSVQPRFATKGRVFSYIIVFVSSSRRMLPFDVWLRFPVTTSLSERLPWIACADFGKTKIVLTTTQRLIAFFSRTFSVVFDCRSLFNEAAYLAALRRLRSPFAKSRRDVNSKWQSKTKIYEKTHLLLRILVDIRTSWKIVMIFVTQNNF